MAKETGAGIILIEEYHLSNHTIPCIILFQNTRKNKQGQYEFTDPGGSREKDESIESAAIRELQEESCNLFRIDQDFLSKKQSVFKYWDPSNPRNPKHIYRSFFLKVANINVDVYRFNREQVEELGEHWQETKAVTRVPLIEFEKETENGFYQDINGNAIVVSNRTTTVIKQGYSILEKMAKQKPLKLFLMVGVKNTITYSTTLVAARNNIDTYNAKKDEIDEN